ncbi:UNVERIFIED_CONTAM: hypothetical protein Sradi_6367700 [Sesamum radiatum]|uniref:Uncharacterized protein n=1 Tax=Sesamum radiatum TaxID=300843 RepID=A0AAW2K2Y3_SESRA
MDALIWTLNHAVVNPSSTCFSHSCLPRNQVHSLPLGNVTSKSSEPRAEGDVRGPRKTEEERISTQVLDRLFCFPVKIKADTIVIESDTEAKAILDLIPILNIRKLVLGATKSAVRRILRSSRKGKGVADEIVQNAPEFCEVKIICEGKEMSEVMVESRSSSSSLSPRITHHLLQGWPQTKNM